MHSAVIAAPRACSLVTPSRPAGSYALNPDVGSRSRTPAGFYSAPLAAGTVCLRLLLRLCRGEVGVVQVPPAVLQRHLLGGQQTALQSGPHAWLVHVQPDADQHLLPVPIRLLPSREDLLLERLALGPLLARHGGPPGTFPGYAQRPPRDVHLHAVVAGGEPHEALAPDEGGHGVSSRFSCRVRISTGTRIGPLPLSLLLELLARAAQLPGVQQRGVQSRGVEGAAGAEDEGGYAVLLALGQAGSPLLGEPFCVSLGLFVGEQPRVHDLLGVHCPVQGLDDLGVGVEVCQRGHHVGQLGLADRVRLVQQQHVRELHLVHQQVYQSPLRGRGVLLVVVVIMARFVIVATEQPALGGAGAGLAQGLRGTGLELPKHLPRGSDPLEISEKVPCIYHRDSRVQPDHLVQVPPDALGVREGLGHMYGLGDAGALDDDGVGVRGRPDVQKLGEQILSQSAADAAVAQLDQLLSAVAHQLGVDVYHAHVVHNHHDLHAHCVGQ
mmetsp:Transcript_5314/g.12138  ORF Transcript_5314/g.12138 Transcript_5314/m.12138 type:complete len:496 (+) Transcript_5314:198-1685(+)